MPASQASSVQRQLFGERSSALGVNGTFFPNYRVAVHRWYPYIEGFSSEFVQGIIGEFAQPGCRIYDPFAGTGTTMAVASANRMLPCYSEINPFMRLVVECKTNAIRHVAQRKREFATYVDRIQGRSSRLVPEADALHDLKFAFGDRQYFRGRRLVEMIALKRAIFADGAPTPAFVDIAKLALASIAVECSEMKRAADLRYRTEIEQLPDDISPLELFHKKIIQILADIDICLSELPSVSCLSASALSDPVFREHVDLVITSPPYVNGTNYFRNTKLELWLAGFLKKESDLSSFRDAALAAGINNISRRGRPPIRIPSVEEVATRLDEVAYDRRIPELIRRYFSDSMLWLGNVSKLLRTEGYAIIDIGDSRFAGVHIPADVLLAEIAATQGLHVDDMRTIRTRKSRDGEPLKQVLLVLRKQGERNGVSRRVPSGVAHREDYREAAIEFGSELPHVRSPYSSRNWGHGLHSLCSYQGKLKPAIAHFLVSRFSSPGDRILDPLSGCGTIPLEAFLQGRVPIGNDLQELGYILTKAKVERGSADGAREVQEKLLNHVVKYKLDMNPDIYVGFGFNGRISDYFHPETYREVLAARLYMVEHPCDSWSKAIVYSSLLHILHGNRPYALSRRSHPVTPFRPTGPSDYRSLAPRLRDKVTRALSAPCPENVINGVATLGSFETVDRRGSIDLVITSPPFAASTRFFSTNWMRLWLAGWEPKDFEERRAAFLEHQQRQSMDVYSKFFGSASRWLRPGGRLIIHAGRSAKVNMAQELSVRAGLEFELVYSFDEDVAGREKFGMRDQGATTSHQYLFFRRI